MPGVPPLASALLMPGDWPKKDLCGRDIDALFGDLSLEKLARRCPR